MDGLHGNVKGINIHDEVKNSFLDYAMSVIVSRALPDVRDGLKPVHRRILYALHELGMTPDKPHKKSARLVGEVLGKYHPHGDSSVYEALVRMAQDFSTRYPLVDGHGNFGSLDGDPAAAMRYTEVRMSKISTEMLRDINKETIDYRLNFDETLEEPKVLPARYPNLLVNGSSGIAVGMATNIPPHNLNETINAIIKLIDRPEMEIEELIESIKGPDFPTGGLILGKEGIYSAYKTGRGSIKTRGRTIIEKIDNGKSQIIVTEIPYLVNKAKMIEKIAELVRDKKIEGITDLRDESDRKGIRVVMELRRGANEQVILNQLYKYTQLQQNFGVILLALVDEKPKVLNLKEMLEHYIAHQKEIIIRRTQFDLKKAEKRAHILEGLKIALDNLDAIIKLIRGSHTTEEAKKGLMLNFKLTEVQAQAILDMRLQKLTGLEREKLEEEYKELLKRIAYYKELLANEKMLLEVIKEELEEIKNKYGNKRRSEIVPSEEEMEMEDFIVEEKVVITLTHQGYIKRLPLSTYKSQLRGGRGVTGMTTRKDDFVEHLFITTTHHNLMCFSNLGKVYKLKAYEIPETGRQSKGMNIVNLLSLESNEIITAFFPVKTFAEEEYLVMATQKGIIKKSRLSEFSNTRKNGLIAISLNDDDELIAVKITKSEEDIFLTTHEGYSIRFHENDVRIMGRTARGVKAINLKDTDRVMGMDLISSGSEVLLVTEKGYGKRTPLDEFKVQRRGGKGLFAIKINDKIGYLAGFKIVSAIDEVVFITKKGIVIRQEVNGISTFSRYARGVKILKLGSEDRLVGLARIIKEEEE